MAIDGGRGVRRTEASFPDHSLAGLLRSSKPNMPAPVSIRILNGQAPVVHENQHGTFGSLDRCAARTALPRMYTFTRPKDTEQRQDATVIVFRPDLHEGLAAGGIRLAQAIGVVRCAVLMSSETYLGVAVQT